MASDDGDTAGFRRVLVTEATHPYLDAWWPPGHTLGWEHTFTHQARDLLTAIANGDQPSPSFADGLAVQRVLHAVQTSAAKGNSWESVKLKGEDSSQRRSRSRLRFTAGNPVASPRFHGMPCRVQYESYLHMTLADDSMKYMKGF